MAKRAQPLVCQHLENISRKALEKHQDVIKDYVKGKQGVYALYRGDRLKYVGLASNLRQRLSDHLRDRHAQSWDKFSVYLTLDDEHLRELEALVIRIAAPKENRQKTKFKKSEDLLPRFKSDVSKKFQAELRELTGEQEKQKTKKKKPKKKTTAKKKKTQGKKKPGKRGKSPLAGLVDKRIKLRADYKGKTYLAMLRKDGTINFRGQIYTSPSRAGMAITKTKTLNGWKFWKFKNDEGEWVWLAELRK